MSTQPLKNAKTADTKAIAVVYGYTRYMRLSHELEASIINTILGFYYDKMIQCLLQYKVDDERFMSYIGSRDISMIELASCDDTELRELVRDIEAMETGKESIHIIDKARFIRACQSLRPEKTTPQSPHPSSPHKQSYHSPPAIVHPWLPPQRIQQLHIPSFKPLDRHRMFALLSHDSSTVKLVFYSRCSKYGIIGTINESGGKCKFR